MFDYGSYQAEQTAIHEYPDDVPRKSIEAMDIPSPGATKDSDQPIGMYFNTNCGSAKFCVDEGRVTRVQHLQTGTVSYAIEEGNKVYLVKTRISNNKVDFDCSCTVTGACTSFQVDAVKYFTTGTLKGSTIRPNMKNLG